MINRSAVAIMQRKSTDDFRHNASLGSQVSLVTDIDICNELIRIAKRITELFDSTIAGVDLFFDEETKTYRFIEINNMPQWKYLQTCVEINISETIMQYLASLATDDHTT